MAKSELRSKVAILRAAMGISMKEFADLTGRTFYTWKALEAGRLRLSEGLAIIISRKTGVSLRWLLDTRQTGPPVTHDGEPFTKESYDRHAASLMAKTKQEPSGMPKSMGRLLTQLLEAMEDHPDFALALYRTHVFMENLIMEFRALDEQLDEQQTKPKKSVGSKKKRPKSVVEELPAKIKTVIAESGDANVAAEEIVSLEALGRFVPAESKIKPEAAAAALRAIMATMKKRTVDFLARPFEASKMRPERAAAALGAIMATMKAETVEVLARAVTPEFYDPGRAEELARAFKSDPETAKVFQKVAKEFEQAVAEHVPSQLGR